MRLGDGIPVRLPYGKQKQDRRAERSGVIGGRVGMTPWATMRGEVSKTTWVVETREK